MRSRQPTFAPQRPPNDGELGGGRCTDDDVRAIAQKIADDLVERVAAKEARLRGRG
jgi:hypothetical protein